MQPASGARDLNPQQVEINQLIGSQLSNVFKLWGYEELAPPYIERLETLMAGDAISNKDILKVVADEPLGLRPEMTTSICRAASTRLKTKPRPLRIWAKGTVFKNKEFREGNTYIEECQQTGVELFGVKSIYAEIELLSLLLESLKTLGLKRSLNTTILIGHTELMELILLNYKPDIRNQVKEMLINFDQIGISKLQIEDSIKNELYKVNKCRGNPNQVLNELEKIYGNVQIIEKVRNLFKTIEPISIKYGVKIQLDPTFSPQFELYNGFIFQLICKSLNNQVVIAKGGRYDKIASLFYSKEEESSGVGFSFSVDNIRELMNEKDIFQEQQDKILIAFSLNSNIGNALDKQREFHSIGRVAIIELNPCQNKSIATDLLKTRKCSKLVWLE